MKQRNSMPLRPSGASAALVALATLAAVATAPAHAALTFTDWTTASPAAGTAAGTIGPVTVSFSGSPFNGATLNGGAMFNNASLFTPALASSDMLELVGLATANTYTVTFSTPVADPVIHLADLSSLISFIGAVPTRVSGTASLTTAGSTIPCDGLGGGSACAGTVTLSGVFSAFSFTALNSAGGDGFFFQVGVDPQAPIPEPATWGLLLAGLGAIGLRARRRQR